MASEALVLEAACNDLQRKHNTQAYFQEFLFDSHGHITEPRIIKGCPRDKWEEVQAIQHEPFIYIQGNGSKWAGDEEDDVDKLLEVLEKYRLDYDRFGPEFYDINPCVAANNPKWGYGNEEPQWIDGERMYACDGVYDFFGNFLELSHGFSIHTNHKPTIDALIAAIEANKSIPE